MRKLIAAFLLLFAASNLWAQAGARPGSGPTKAIDAARIRAHVRFLSHDLLEGRGTGQRGGDLAAEYIATQFALFGLAPAGENGTYLQRVPLVGVTTQPETTLEIAPASGAAMRLKLADEYVTSNPKAEPARDIDAPMVFVGYGISAPEYQWDDYKGADLNGKFLLMLVNEPPSDDVQFFKGKALTYYGRWTYKFEEAARRGAVGALVVHKTEMASYGWNVVRNSWGGENSYLRGEQQPRVGAQGWVQLEVARKLLAAAGQELDALMQKANGRDFRPIELPLRVKMHVVSKVRPFDSSNVVGQLTGSDPQLKQQAVLYSAHYDHFGVSTPVNGDSIYNGAVDNGTGCGMLLEMARAFAMSPEKPRRSVIFAAVTAEEQGLLGSQYLGLHPPLPARDISLGLNFDGLHPLGIPEEVVVNGSERTTFYPAVQQTAKQFGLTIKADPRPEAGHFYRSDHFSLARVGVPSFSVGQGDKFRGHDAKWGADQVKDYTDNRYHQPSDEYRPEMNFDGNALLARFGVALGWRAANQAAEVEWKPGDEFEPARQRSRAD